jgi:hypothetical protein
MLVTVVLLPVLAAVFSACTMEEESTRVAGAYCDYEGLTACDETFMTVLYCNYDMIWEPREDCPNGCTEEYGYAECIGGSPDTVTDKDTALPDEAVAEMDEMDDVDEVDTTVDEDAVTDEVTDVDEVDEVDTTVDEDAVTDEVTDMDEVDDMDLVVDTTVDEDAVTDETPDADTVEGCGDWTLNDATGTCYRYFAAAKDFPAAETACVAETGHLVNIASADENDWVRDNLAIPADTAYWLGYTAKDAVGPGTGSANGQSCGSSSFATNAGGGTYNFSTSGASTFSTGCLCTGSTVSGKFVVFKFVPSVAGRWELAMNSTSDGHMSLYTSCSCSAKLACANNTTSGWEVINTYNFTAGTTYYIMISGPTNLTGTFYIRPPVTAANFASQYVWTDGVSHGYHNFATGQPDYGSGNERCAHVRVDAPWGQWNDNACSTVLPYVCEKGQ